MFFYLSTFWTNKIFLSILKDMMQYIPAGTCQSGWSVSSTNQTKAWLCYSTSYLVLFPNNSLMQSVISQQ